MTRPSLRARPFGRWRLSSRMALLSVALLLMVQLAGLLVIRASVAENARAGLAAELAVAERVWQRLLEQRATKLGQGAALLAADYGFRSAVSSDDRATIASALDNHGARIDAALAALLDTRLAVRAHSAGADAALLPVLQALAPQLERQGSAVVAVAGRPVQLVMVPMRAPVLIGWVVMGFELDRGLVDELHAVSGLHGTLLAAGGGPPVLLRSSLPQPALAAALASEVAAPLPAAAGPALEARLDGAPWLLRRVPVAAGAPQGIDLWLGGSVAQALSPFAALQLTLAVLTGLGLVLFGLGSVWVARRVTRPLAALVRASERLGRGDLRTPLEGASRGDEVGELSKAFEQMRVNLGEQQQAVHRLAYWDRLTGLPNRVQFGDAVQAAIAAGQPLGVLMLDLDRFKHVNDVLGYTCGDRLLQGVAGRLQQAAGPSGLVARLGGDEFALLLRDAGEAELQALAARVMQAFEQPLLLDDQRVDLSAGLGMACAPQHAQDGDTLLSRAEVAMYAAKRRTAGAQLYDPSLDSTSAQTLSLLSELRQAVEAGELRLFLQPKVAVADAALVGAEALVRWQHPQRGLVPPMQFIPFAEQTGFVRQLTLWVVEEAARQWPALQRLGVRRLSVNLSTRDLMDGELPDKLQALLARHGAPAWGFCLEITESAIMDDPERAEHTLNRLAASGFKLSIDDFGTGYSSLAYLRRLPVHELKIDKSFVMGMARDGGDEKIVRSTVDLAHNLGLSVVAEGVEDAAILQRLAALGCDEAQGYHLSRPLPLPAFVDWARAHRARASDASQAPATAA